MVWRVSCSVVVAMWACKAPERTPDLAPIVAKTGPLELLADDGEPTGIPIAEYVQRAAARSRSAGARGRSFSRRTSARSIT